MELLAGLSLILRGFVRLTGLSLGGVEEACGSI